MTTTLLRAGALTCALLTSTCLTPAPAFAQTQSQAAFPVRQPVDENGVDLLTGSFTATTPAMRIGDGELGLSYLRALRDGTFRDTLMGTITIDGAEYSVDIGGSSENFHSYGGGSFSSPENTGSTLNVNGSTYTYTMRGGAVAIFGSSGATIGPARGIVIQSITHPNGLVLTFHYTQASFSSGGITTTGRRLQSVTSNSGYQIKLRYASDSLASLADLPSWSNVSRVTGLNDLVDSCSPTAFSCTVAGRPELIIASQGGAHDYTDSEGRTTRFTVANGKVTGIRFPGSTSDDISVSYTNDRVSSITRFGVTTTYGHSDLNGVRTVTVTRPGSATRVATFDIANTLMLSDRDELNRTTTYQFDSFNRAERVTRPEGNSVTLNYDDWSNVWLIEQREKDDTGDTADDIRTSANFPANCLNQVTCHLPTSTGDARGNFTSFVYDQTHGGVVKITAPAAVGNASAAERPQTRITYARLGANGSPSASGIFRPTEISSCRSGSTATTAPCVGTVNETRTVISYGQNLLPTSVTTRAGDNSLSATYALGWDAIGNLLTMDGPLSGTADTSRYRYNAARERIGTISADPDGAGTLKHRAQRVTIGSRGLVTKVETGTVDSQSDAHWAAFAPLQAVEAEYDANRRPIVQRMTSGSTTYALTQTSYDNRGRTECVAQRMNAAEFATSSLPASACTLDTQGSFGPDRIVKTTYDAAGQVILVQTGYGVTGVQADEVATTYRPNGQVATMSDGMGSKTTYVYDGHDRLYRTQFPHSQVEFRHISYEALYEELGYDPAGNVTSLRLRDGQTIAYTYDNLNRLTLTDLPGTEPDVAYGYDLLGNLSSAATSAQTLTFTFDALGRNLTEVGPQGTLASVWDLADRRTRLTYPGSFHIDYDYLVTGEMSRIRENGATATTCSGSTPCVLATFAYDDLGRRTSLTRGNGLVTSYGFDAASRLDQLVENPAGASYDQTVTFAYNPASQIATREGTNNSFAHPNLANQNVTDLLDGLNRVTATGATSISHDGRGNITGIGGESYSYDSENRMTTGGGITFGYDPLGRLYSLGASAKFSYDGIAMVEERNGAGTLVNRYVHGPGVDEPIVWYEGTNQARRWYHPDERGSAHLITNEAGSAYHLNRYDEYGVPHNQYGRFAYTGQIWLSAIGMHYYKARIYNPSLGRFMQTDPIGYEAGMNLYAYVRGDPVNFIDWLGLDEIVITGCNGVWVGDTCDKLFSPGTYDPDRVGRGERLAGDRYERFRMEVAQNPERVQLACGRRGLHECARLLRQFLSSTRAKPRAPFPRGPRRGDFARRAGFRQGPEASARAMAEGFDAEAAMRDLQEGGYTRQDVVDWQRFYADVYRRQEINLTAFYRSEALRMILGVWP